MNRLIDGVNTREVRREVVFSLNFHVEGLSFYEKILYNEHSNPMGKEL